MLDKEDWHANILFLCILKFFKQTTDFHFLEKIK